ncbi:MAG: PAS domain S-box protein, partial [Nitrospiraceae bacterium]
RFVCDSLVRDYRTQSAFNGQEGLQKAVELRPDLIVTDVMMPGMTGDEFLRAARGRRELESVPIMLLTAKADDDCCVALLREGAQDCLLKPFSPGELRARAENLIAAKRTRETLQRELDGRKQAEMAIQDRVETLPRPATWRHALFSYALAGASTGVATWFRLLLDPFLGDHIPYATFFGAVIVTAWYGGFGPSLLALMLGLASTIYFFIPPRLSLNVAGAQHLVGIGMYLFIGISGALLIRSQRTAQLRAEAGVLEAFNKRRELEQEIAERAQAEDAVRQSEIRMRAVLENALDAVIGMDGDGIIDDWNPRAEFIFGWTRAEAVGRPLADTIIPPHYREAHRRGLRHFLRTGEGPALNRRFEITALARDGKEFPVELAISPLRIGGCYRFNAFIADITDRKRTEQELRGSEERYRSLTLAVTSIVWTTDAGGEFACPQRSWEAYTGQAWEEHKGFGWSQALHPDDRERVQQIWEQALAARMTYESEGRIWCAAAGAYRYFVARGVPLLNPDGSVREWVGTVTDVNDRRNAEEALRESQAKLIEAQRIGKVGSWEVDLLTNTVQWSEQTYRIFGHDPRSFAPAGNGFYNMVHPLDRHAVHAAVEKARRTHSSYRIRHRIIRPDGAERVVAERAEVIRNEAGTPVAMIGTVQDITDRHRAEEAVRKLNAELEQRVAERTAELEAAYKELEAFSYSVSHDLRAPLRHIDGYAELLKKQAAAVLDERARRHLTTISESAKQMGLLVDNLLVFSRMGRADMSRTAVDVAQLAKDVMQELRPDMEGREIVWKVGALPHVQADPAMLKQVVFNLLSNALKYTRVKACAEIEIASDTGSPDEIVIFVRDNGVGFDMQYVHKLFGVFQRLHRAEEFEGTGIGLANVRRIIHRHGGRTWAQGAVNQGATFYFSLPRMEAVGSQR